MEEPKEMFESLIEKGEQYGKTTLELLKLKTADKSSDVVSTVISWMVVIAFAVIFFTIVNIGVALWLGKIMGESYLGFFAVGGFYAFLTIVFGIFRNRLIKKPLNNTIVKQILD
jgi:hypothetical protein